MDEVLRYFQQLNKGSFKAEPLVIGVNDSFVIDCHRNWSDIDNQKNLDNISCLLWKIEKRDTHLKLTDFINTSAYKQLLFKSTHYEGTKRKESSPEIDDTWYYKNNDTKAGFTVNGKMSRKEFGLVWGAVTEAGSVVVGDEVKLHAEIQLIKQP